MARKMYGKPYQNSTFAKNSILYWNSINSIETLYSISILTLLKNVCKLPKKGFLTGFKPEQSHKTDFRDKGFWQKDYVGESISNIKNLCLPGKTYFGQYV